MINDCGEYHLKTQESICQIYEEGKRNFKI